MNENEREPMILNPLKTMWQRKWLRLDVTHPKLQTLADAAAHFCRNWIQQTPRPGLLFIAGITGTGKSHVGRTVAAYCRQSTHLAIKHLTPSRTRLLSTFTGHWPALADEFRQKNFSALPDLFESDFLLLDDVGSEDDPFKIAADKFCQVLSHREQKFTVITSNLLPEEFTRTDPRISDRLLRNSETVELNGVKSYAEYQRMAT